MELGLYILDNSAYAICSFSIIPFDNSAHIIAEYVFNFHYFSYKIYIECPFGKIDA